jgi:hypothetical protein
MRAVALAIVTGVKQRVPPTCSRRSILNCRKAGAARGIRTPDPVITNDVLYRLSYCGLNPRL